MKKSENIISKWNLCSAGLFSGFGSVLSSLPFFVQYQRLVIKIYRWFLLSHPKSERKIMIDVIPSEKGRKKLLKAKLAAKKRREKEKRDSKIDEREVDPVKEAKESGEKILFREISGSRRL